MGRPTIPSLGCDREMCDVLERWDVNVPWTINEINGQAIKTMV
jgi:hypothetical protein